MRVAAIAAVAALLGGCGSSDEQSTSSGGTSATGAPAGDVKQGGELTYLTSGDVDSLDPGKTCSAFAYAVDGAMHRTLYALKPGSSELVADIATGPAKISSDAKTVTVKLRRGVRYAPPVDREVRSGDIKYAIERAFSKQVNNCQVSSYFDLVGAPAPGGDFKQISGIETPDAHTIVFRLSKPTATTLVSALVELFAAPVPPEVAKGPDAANPSTYAKAPATTGPYMLERYRPGVSIVLRRNPNWSADTDFRPAYLDRITISQGNDDLAIAARRTLDGTGLACCDTNPPGPVMKQILSQPDQALTGDAGVVSFITLNDRRGPFTNANLRRAVFAQVDRNAMLLSQGGQAGASVATGLIPPGVTAFDAAGGESQAGELDFAASTAGDADVAKQYMLKAKDDGAPVDASGRYTGSEPITLAGMTGEPSSKAAQVLEPALEALGFDVEMRLVDAGTYFSKFCEFATAPVDVCANNLVGKDFPDAISMMGIFTSEHLAAVKDPKVDELFDAAAVEPAGAARDEAWAAMAAQIMSGAVHIPYAWPRNVVATSSDVAAALSPFWSYQGIDFSFSGLR